MRPNNMGIPISILIFILGILSIYINWDSDNQRQIFRAKKGELLIWGKKPDFIIANYQTKDGKTHESLLLCDGYWGLARHFHYVPEWLAAFFWSIPGSIHNFTFTNYDNIGHLFYIFYLAILLTDRAYRDDARCRGKYGKFWDQYCQKVPYKIIPYIL